MTPRIHRLFRFIGRMSLIAMLAGCSFTMSISDISQLSTVSPLNKVRPRSFTFKPLNDLRGASSLVILKYGVHTITLEQPPTVMAATSITREFQRNGHRFTENPAESQSDFVVDGEVNKYDMRLDTSSSSMTVTGKVAVTLTVRAQASGKGVFKKTYEGERHMSDPIAVHSAAWKVILDQAQLAMLQNMSMDRELTEFISQ